MGIASNLISAYEAGQDRRRMLIERQRADDKQSRLDALYLKLQPGTPAQQAKGGDPQSGGVAGVYAPPQAPAAPSQDMPLPVAGGQPDMPAPAPVATTVPHPAQQSFLQQHAETLSQIMGIDPAVGAQLVANYSKLDEAQRAEVKRGSDFMGQATLDVSRLPEADRPAAWAAYVRQAEQSGLNIPQHYETYSPQALRSAAAEANVTKELLAQFEPKYVNVVPGTDAVNVNPRAAIDPFSGRGPTPAAPQQAEDPAQVEKFLQTLPPSQRDAARAAIMGGASVPQGSPLSPTNNAVGNAAQLRREADDAIARGADPAKVNARLRQMGVR